MTQQRKILVIGSGFGGLAAAIRLAARGHDVTVLEKRDKPGGRAYVYELDGYTFDGGPTIITAPYMFDELWEVAGKKREDYVEFVETDPYYRIYNADGLKYDFTQDKEDIVRQIEQISPEDVAGYHKFLEATQPIFEKGFVQLADVPFLTMGDMLKVAPDLIKLQSYTNVYPYVGKFIKNEFLRQVFSFHPLLIGGNPFDASSIYAMIHYLELKWGVWFAMGGTGALVKAMVKLFEDIGGTIHYNVEVDEIVVGSSGRSVIGVRMSDGEFYEADDVVSNADVATTYMHMIDKRYRRANGDWRYKAYKYSMSLYVLYFGTDRQYRDHGIAHHNIILGPRYKDLLSDIFNKKIVADDFSLYLHMPTITDPSLAPEGGESFYVLSPVPHLGADVDWTTFAPVYRDRLVGFLEDNYMPGLNDSIVTETHIDPLHFKHTLNSHLGAAFSVQPTLTQSAWFRPHNRAEEFDNLYIVGAGTHPGAGLPGVLSTAAVVDKLMMEKTGVVG